MTEFIESPPGIKRRTVVKTAAWSVPVIAAAVATPLAAATVCSPGSFRRETLTVVWNNSTASSHYSRSDAYSGTATVMNACGEVVTTVSVASSFGSGVQPNTTADAGDAVNVGGPNLSARAAGLRLSQRRVGGGYGPGDFEHIDAQDQTVVLTFSNPVHNLRFSVKDIDTERAGFGEQATVTSPGGVTIGAGARLISGPTGYYYTEDIGNQPVLDEDYWINCTIPGVVSQATVKYFTCTPGGGGVLGNLTFEADVPCDCDEDAPPCTGPDC